jgi:GNAT superfamily N-acetyltransferase
MPHPFERRFKQKIRQSEIAHFEPRRPPMARRKVNAVASFHGHTPPRAVEPVTQLTIADRQKAVTMMTRAFIADPPSRFLYPELDKYERAFPRFVSAFAGAAFDRQGAYGIGDLAGVALWLPPGAHPDETALDMLFEDTIPAGRRAEVFEIIERMSNYHPAEPHWHLAMIGVEPDEVRKGYGSALLEAGLARVDRSGQTAYLESTNPRNIPLYERFGFRLVGTIDTGRCPPIFPMVRRIA